MVLLCTVLTSPSSAADERSRVNILDIPGLDNPSDILMTGLGTAEPFAYIADTGNNRIQKVTFDDTGAVTDITTLNTGTLNGPEGLALDPYNRLYIADTGNNRIRKVTFNSAGVPSTTTIDAGTLDSPRGLAIQDGANLLIADTGNNIIVRVNIDYETGATNGYFPFYTGTLDAPEDVSTYDNDILVTDTGNNQVLKLVGPNGSGDYEATAINSGTLTAPAATLGSYQTRYVADTGANQIQAISYDDGGNQTGVATLAAGELSSPKGLTEGVMGSVLIVDSGNNRIVEYLVNLPPLPSEYGIGIEGLQWPDGIALDTEGDLYVADQGRIQRVGFNSAGSPTSTTAIDTVGHAPSLAIDSNGTLYAVDAMSNVIKKITFDGSGTPTATTLNTGTLTNPWAIALDTEDNLYISTESGILRVTFDGSGTPSTAALTTGVSSQASDLAFDSEGSLYASNREANQVQKVTFDGSGTPTATTLAYSRNALSPTAIAFDSEDNLFVASLTGTVGKVTFGTGDPVVTAVNTGPLSGAESLVFDSDGNLYIAHTGASQILRINLGSSSPATSPAAGPRKVTGAYAGTAGSSGAVARLYMATFGRNPEQGGFEFWKSTVDGGRDIQHAANFFAGSPEFATLYGDTTDEEFVELMYGNVMDRASDSEGFTFWLAKLDEGLSRGRMLLLFAESTEFRTITGTN